MLTAVNEVSGDVMRRSSHQGGPKVGSGRQPMSRRDWVRSEGLRVSFRPGEMRDLQTIAKAWRVPVATATWAIVHERLAHWRRRSVELGEHGLAIASAVAVLRMDQRQATDTNASGYDGSDSREEPVGS